MAVRDDELNPVKSARNKAAQKAKPGRAVFAGKNVDSEYLTCSAGIHAGRDYRRYIGNSTALAALVNQSVHQT